MLDNVPAVIFVDGSDIGIPFTNDKFDAQLPAHTHTLRELLQ